MTEQHGARIDDLIGFLASMTLSLAADSLLDMTLDRKVVANVLRAAQVFTLEYIALKQAARGVAELYHEYAFDEAVYANEKAPEVLKRLVYLAEKEIIGDDQDNPLKS